MSTPQATLTGTAQQPASDADLQMLNVDDRLQEEMQRLASINQELLGTARPGPEKTFTHPEEPDELTLLRSANVELRARVEKLEEALQAGAPAEDSWSERQKEFEALLEEKSEVIRSLHLRIQELQDTQAGPAEVDMSESQLLQKEMADQRRQLEEDEESLMQQMRQMEMAMSKDRAELARQRNEVQRLHNELNHEIEMASRDPGLRERLVALQRLQGEMSGRKQTAAAPAAGTKQSGQKTDAPAPARKENSGLLRRIFGK
jgi:chromosome segregation ATPase